MHVADMGEVKLYSLRGKRPTVSRWKKGDGVESYTVTVLTMLDGGVLPLLYDITPGGSNG